MLEVVNLIVGFLAILVSFLAIFLSHQYSKNAENALQRINEKADNIEKDIRNRLDDLVKRAAPSQEEQVMAGVMGEFFKAVMSDKQILGKLVEEGLKQQKKR